MRSFLVGALLLISWPAGAAGDAHVATFLEAARTKHKLPALAGAIVTSDGLKVQGVTGVRKAGSDVVATIDDDWHLGSDTKAMTATILARLVEAKKLTWQTTLAEQFPALAPQMNAAMRTVTLQQLLTHRAGLPANLDWDDLARSKKPLREQRLEAVRLATSVAPINPPGSKMEYSNLGYVLAGAMAEQAAGDSWEHLMKTLVFEPLGMQHCGFGGLGTKGLIDQPWPHEANGRPTPENGPEVDNPPVMGPAGTVHCTLADWGRFIADQLRGERGDKALLRTDSYRILHSPPAGSDYAFGWQVTDRPWGGGTVFMHAGSNTMNFALVWIAPKRDFAVLATTNQGGDEAFKGADEAVGALVHLQTGH